jgi:WD40 repeat protein
MDLASVYKVQLQKQSAHSSCYSLCFKVDYSQLIVACSNDLFFLSPLSGRVLDQKRMHHAPVYCVRCSVDGIYFASSSSDGTVVVWRAINNEAFVSYGSQSAARHLAWCPTKQLLISSSSKEYSLWQPGDSQSPRKPSKDPIDSICFSPNGEVFVISYATGVVNVMSTEDETIVQTFNYSSVVTVLSYVTIEATDYIVIADLDCRVSLFRASDKTLVGKNSLPFEALACGLLPAPSSFFAFAGVSGKISLLSPGLSYLGDFGTDSKWIWDIAVDRQGRLALATKEGFVELRAIEFRLAFSCAGEIVAYQASINTITCFDMTTQKSTDVTFLKVICALGLSPRYLYVQFKDSVVLFRYEKVPQGGELQFTKISELPGQFEKSLFSVAGEHVFGASEKVMTVYDVTGHSICKFSFQATITFLSPTSSEKDGVLASCADGCVYFVVLDQLEPVLLVQHDRSIAWASREGLTVAVIDVAQNCCLFDSFSNHKLCSYEKVTTFAFSDRIEGLYATSDGSTLSIYYREYTPVRLFIEGDVLGFIRNRIALSNAGSLEVVDAQLPLAELVEAEDWDAVSDFMGIGLRPEQWQYLASEALKRQNLEIAKLCAPSASPELAFFIFEIAPMVDSGRWAAEINALLGEGKRHEPESAQDPTRANELEAAGVSEEALQIYASCGDWENVLRLARECHLERCIVDYQFPPEVSEEAAKVLLDAGLGDGAIRILTKTQNIESLARAHVYLGQWAEAISLSRLYSSVYNIFYPRFGQLLFESGQWFEALVCFFIPQDRDERRKVFNTLFGVIADAGDCEGLAFIRFLIALNDPDLYWRHFPKVLCYLAAHRLKHFVMIPLSEDDAHTVFFLAYYVMACHRVFAFRAIAVTDVLTMLLTSASMLGRKRWVAYALRELGTLDVDDATRHLAQRAGRPAQEVSEAASALAPCPRCRKDLYASSRQPLLVCGVCGVRIAFSTFSCRALPLFPFEFAGDGALEAIAVQPKVGREELPPDTVDEAYLRESPAERFVVQKLKEKSGVPIQLWYNADLEDVRTCGTCGAMFTEEDWENSVLATETCPVCRVRTAESAFERKSDVLEMLRSFEEASPVDF